MKVGRRECATKLMIGSSPVVTFKLVPCSKTLLRHQLEKGLRSVLVAQKNDMVFTFSSDR